VRIERSISEVFSKISGKTLFEIARLLRDVRQPLQALQIFLGLKAVAFPWMISLRSGYRIPMETIYDFRQAFWDSWVRKSYTVHPWERVIVDVGANIGCFVIYAASKSPESRVYAFEPSSVTFARLQSLVKINGLEDRVVCFRFGVARKTGELLLDTSMDRRLPDGVWRQPPGWRKERDDPSAFPERHGFQA
jgi:hypothetical protein